MPHYFTNDNVEKRPYVYTAPINGREFRFITSDGVFSKKHIDEGTKWLLTAVIPLITDEPAAVADLGCGYGVIGVVIAAFKPNARCYMLDINAQAVVLANENAGLHGVSDRASAILCDGLSLLPASVDYIVTNPPFRAGKQVVLRFFQESRAALLPGGILYAVLRKQQGAASYISAITDMFGNLHVLLKKKGYVVVAARKSD